jgi:hypothetical protein
MLRVFLAIITLAFSTTASTQDNPAAAPAEKEVQLPQYQSWPGYAAGMPFVIRRYCGLWGRGT